MKTDELNLETLTIREGEPYPEVDGGTIMPLSEVPHEELEKLITKEESDVQVPRYSSRFMSPPEALLPNLKLGAVTKSSGYIMPIVYAIRRVLAEVCRDARENANGPGVGGRIGYFENWPTTVISCGDGSYKVCQRGYILREADIAAQLKREEELEEELKANKP